MEPIFYPEYERMLSLVFTDVSSVEKLKAKPSSFNLRRTSRIGIAIVMACVLLFKQGHAQNFTLDTIPYADIDIVRPGAGANAFYGSFSIGAKVPSASAAAQSLDNDTRHLWSQLQTGANSYNWGPFDQQVQYCIDNNMRYSFGIETVCTTCPSGDGVVSYAGGSSSYPQFIHDLMQGESVRDWLFNGVWIPNWNSEAFLSNWEKFLIAVNNHIETSSYKSVPFKNVVYKVDVRGFGDWGEWHTATSGLGKEPSGTKASEASLKRIIDAHFNAFKNYQMMFMINTFHGEVVASNTNVATYALQKQNNIGYGGVKSDHLFDVSSYALEDIEKNPNATIKQALLDRYKIAPLGGEPVGTASVATPSGSSCAFSDGVRQANIWHLSQFNNQKNPSQAAYSQACVDDNYRAISKRCGYRLQIYGGNISVSNGTMQLTANWGNIGIAPIYENWDVYYELRDGTKAVWSEKSSFTPKLFLPGKKTVTDNFTPGLSGTYSLYLIIKDPLGYRKPLPLTNKNRGTDGSYLLTTVNLSSSTTNKPPIADAGSNQTVSLPVSLVSLNGGGSSDPDGSITSYTWTKSSGPASVVINNSTSAVASAISLVQGTYVFKLTVKDNNSATASDSVTITVNPLLNQAPVANAGPNQTITLPSNSIALDGSTSKDPDGSISSYAWAKVSGPSQGTISNATSSSANASNLVQGTYVFSLTVTDNNNATNTASVTITVNPVANQLPVANAGANQTITLPANAVTLTGSASNDPDGTISTYTWTKTSGPTQGTISNATSASATATNLVQGTYVFTLTVKDNGNATDTDDITITVNAAPNVAPVANAGGNKTITLPTNSVTLNGSASSDADGTISTYTWTKTSGPAQGTISNATSASATATNLVQGTYVFTLTVKDNSNATNTASVTVTVNAAINQVPVANAGSNQTITLPTNSATLNGSASSDPDGSISSYTWTKTSGPAQGTISNATSTTATATNLVQGTYVFTLTVKDNSNATDAATVTITVNAAPNIAPVANAGSNQTITLPTNSVTLNGSTSSDADGTIATYTWTKVSGPAQGTISNAANASTTATNLAEGTYVFSLTVKDNGNATDTDDITITVNAAPNVAPVANAGGNKTITLPTNSVTLNGSASSDADGTISTYTWTKTSGPAQGTISNATSASATATNLVQGTYVFTLTVKDNSNATNTASVTVTVNAAINQVPVANAGSNQTITLPTNSATLNGSASSDPDGSISSYTWTKTSGPAQGTISNATSTTATATNLIQGTYVFTLTVKDNSNATDAATVTITVNAAPNIAPVANAGSNQTITLPTNSVTLNGSTSSDADGTIATYTWTKVSGPAQGTISNAANASTTATNLAEGTYVFRLTVKDNSDATDTDDVTITVDAAPNQAPIANAGSNQTITLPTNSATLNGSASSDPDGTIASYAWVRTAGTAVTINNVNTPTPTVSGLLAGRYTFELTVTDNDGATAKSTVRITVVEAVDQNPVADAGSNQTITLPVNTISLNGSGSSDADGTITTYAWTKASGPAQGNITNANQSATTANNLAEGVYIFKLVVTDNNANTASDSVTITVNAAVNKVPVANSGSNINIQLPTNTVTLDGSQSNDADGTIVSFSWIKLTGGAATITGAGTVNPTITGLVAGQYTFELTVTDNKGATAKAQVRVTVRNAANQPPVANAGSNKTITLPVNSTTLDGSNSTDIDGTITSYNWTKLTGGTATITGAGTTTPSITGLLEGPYTFELTVTDNRGASTKAQVTVTVNASINQPAVADAGTDQNITLPVNNVTLDGSKSTDADGTIASYSWVKLTGGTATITGAGTTKPLITGLVEGLYTFELTVTDNKGAISKAQVDVTVNAVINQPPVANAGANQTITLPVNNVTLDGSKSTDADGTIASYNWVKLTGGAATITGAGTATPAITGLEAGRYTFELTVTDNKGASTKAQVRVTVNVARNQLPVANAGSNQTITLPLNSVTLDGSKSTDADGTITSYNWVKVTGGAATITGAGTVNPKITGLIEGQYSFELTVTDNRGATGKAQVQITVRAAANQPPVANAGSNQIITLPENTVTLDGSKSSDADGTIASYSWAKIAGGAAIINGGATANPTITGLVEGVYTFEVTVTDNKGVSTKADVTVTVNAIPNKAPIADAGINQNILPTVNNITLNGSKSYDPDGTIISYKWAAIAGPAVTITNEGTVAPVVSGFQAGQEYTFELTVTDNKGAVAAAQVKIVVNSSSNLSPVANAGSNRTITLPENTVILDGSKSTDPDGTIVSYNWAKTDGASAVTITNVNTATPTIAGLQEGQYTFELTVTDNRGASTKAQVTITVVEGTNIVPVANAGADQVISLPATSAKLNGSKSFDPDGTIVSYSWIKIEGVSAVNITNVNTATPTISGLKVGEYVFEITVTDNKGATDKTRMRITVTPEPAQPPVADAGEDIIIAAPKSTVLLDGSSSYDRQGNITTYSWEQLEGPDASILSADSSMKTMVNELKIGQYLYKLTVKNSRGITASSTVKVTVVDNSMDFAQVNVYPNPATTTINIRVISDSVGMAVFNIYDISGRPVKKIEINKQLIDNLRLQVQGRPANGSQTNSTRSYFNTPVNVSQLTNGVYIIETILDNNRRVTSKFVKQ